jgi:hypothetical protein
MKHELKLLPAESLKVQVALANEIETLGVDSDMIGPVRFIRSLISQEDMLL